MEVRGRQRDRFFRDDRIGRYRHSGYTDHMTATELRREIKKLIDSVPPERLESLVDYVHFLNRPELSDRLKVAETAIAAGRGKNWRKVRKDV